MREGSSIWKEGGRVEGGRYQAKGTSNVLVESVMLLKEIMPRSKTRIHNFLLKVREGGTGLKIFGTLPEKEVL